MAENSNLGLILGHPLVSNAILLIYNIYYINILTILIINCIANLYLELFEYIFQIKF